MLNKSFDGLMVKLASPERIKELSNGAVESPDTINYRTGKPKNKGLFCESIFGPVRNYECSCGRYKGVRYKGIVCERCGVEVVNSRVRRERMGHIELASPVAHIWYIKATPSRLGLLLDLSVKEIEKIIYFVKYVVVDLDEKKKKNVLGNLDKDYENKLKELDKAWEEESKGLEEKKKDMDAQYFKYKKEELEKLYSSNKENLEKEYSRVKSILANLKVGSTILESDYRNIFFKYQGTFNFQSGADALYKLLERIDVGEDINSLLKTFNGLKTGERDKSFKKLRFLINLYVSGIRPEWMILKYLPVMPPELRPVVQLEGGKFASSDINLFYRRVLMRNLRLRKMIEAGMPEVIKKNEVRLLQEAVNNLIVGEKDNAGSAGAGVKVFKSLTDMLSGKEGIFRKNLLGKRVDYSGRSVITVGPELNLDECGLPLYIAVRMFTPFIIGKLIDRKLVHTPKQAEKLIKDEDPVALKILEEVIKDKYVLLNRAPTLHRLGIQAFKIRLVPGKTIRIHPLVCNAFNADFDGDQMAVHLPLSEKAQEEVKNLIASDKNILKPASGEPIINHSQDMVLGIYYLTSIWDSNLPKVGRFSSLEEVRNYFYSGNLKIGENIEVIFNGENIETTVGRVLFNLILPKPLRFVNEEINKKTLKKLLDKVYDVSGREETVFVADEIKNWGLKYSTLGAVSINAFDFVVPTEKQKLIEEGDEKVIKIHNFWYKGFYSDEEKHRLVVKVWTEVKNEIGKLIKSYYGKGNDVYSMIDSGARGDWSQLTQISGMMGMVASPSGKIIELPVKSSYFEGFSPIEYFIAAHGARKGKADTALKTAESGYLTRRLVDATQEVVIREEDCGSEEGLIISREEAQMRGEDFYELLMGRTVLDDTKDSKGNIVLKSGTFLDKEKIKLMENSDIENIRVRSPLTCNTPGGVCQKCYGMDLSTRDVIKIGTAIGIVSSQSIGEPATQLTMRTFHGGGTASSEGDMTQGIKRIEELFEVRKPAKPAIVCPFDGTAQIKERGNSFDIEIISEPQQKTYLIKDGYKVNVKKGDYLKKGGIYASKGKSKLKIVEEGEVISIKDDHIIIGELKKVKKPLSAGTRLKIKDGDQVFKGQVLSTGALDVREYKDIVGYLEAQKYIVREIKKVYTSQGQDVNDKYMELVIKQLFSKIVVEDAGDSSFIPGSVIKYEQFKQINEELEKEGKQKAKGERLILGLTQIAKESDSWLSAASFQETMRVMVDSSTKGAIDKLEDLKSNVIIGRLLPVGDLFEKEYYKKKQE